MPQLLQRKTVWISLLIAVVSLWLCWYFAVPRFVAWQIGRQCKYCLAADFQHNGAFWQNSKLVILRPQITTTLGDCQLDCRKAEIAFELYPSDWKLVAALTLDNPQLTIDGNIGEVVRGFNLQQKASSPFTIEPQLKIVDGVLSTPTQKHWKIDFNADFGQEIQSEFSIVHLAGKLKGHFHSKESNRFIDIEFDRFPIETIHDLRWLDPWLEGITVRSGNISGTVNATQSKYDSPFINGNLIADHLIMGTTGREFELELPQAELTLDHCGMNLEGKSLSDKIRLKWGEEGKLCFIGNVKGKPLLQLSEFKGMIERCGNEMKIDFGCRACYAGEKLDLHIQSTAKTEKAKLAAAELSVSLSEGLEEKSHLYFTCNTKDKHLRVGELRIDNFRKPEFQLLKACMQKQIPALRFLDMHKGCIDVHLIGNLSENRPQELQIENINLRDFNIALPEWEITVQIPEAKGQMTIDFQQENPWESLDAEITLDNASISCGFIDSPIEQIDASIHIKKGRLDPFTLQGKFAELNGNVIIDGNSAENLAKAQFHGGMRQIAKLMPARFSQGLERGFIDDTVFVDIAVSSLQNGASIKTLIDIHDSKTQQSYPIHCAFDAIKTDEKIWGVWPPKSRSTRFWQDGPFAELRAFAPQLIVPSLLIACEIMSSEAGWNGLFIDNGRFSANNLPMEKFCEPFLFVHEQFNFKGIGDFEGTFDLDGAVVNYESKVATLENEDLNIEVSSPNAVLFSGKHHFDFIRDRDGGDLWLKNGFYYDKVHGLLFSDLDMEASLVDSRIHIDAISVSCQQMKFKGAIDIDYSCPDPGIYDVDVYVKEMTGKASQLQAMISHFPGLKTFGTLPIEGDIALSQSGGILRFASTPNDFRLQATVEGSLSNGFLTLDSDDVALDSLSLGFNFDHENKILSVNDVKGNLHLGKAGKSTDYTIDGSQIEFTNLSTRASEFDLRLTPIACDEGGKCYPPFLKLKGDCHTTGNDNLHIKCDTSKSHFVGISPHSLELVLNDDLDVDSFHLNFPFRLEDIYAGLTPVLASLMHNPKFPFEANQWPQITGDCVIDLNYDSNTAQLVYNMEAKQLSLGKKQYDLMLLNGKKKGSRWSIEQLQLDDLTIAADLLKSDNKLCCDFIGLRCGDALLAGLTGEYAFDKSRFDGKINLLEIDLSRLSELPKCSEFALNYHPKGKLKANGGLAFEFDNSSDGLRIFTDLMSQVQDLQLKGITFAPIANLPCRLDSQMYLGFGPLPPTPIASTNGETLGTIEFARALEDFSHDQFSVEGLHFTTEASQLPLLTDQLQASFPKEVTDFAASLLRCCKHEGLFKTEVSLNKSPNDFVFTLKPMDDSYWLFGREHDIRNASLTLTPKGANLLLQYRMSQALFWVNCMSETFSSGQIYCSSQFPKGLHDPNDLLTINWRDDATNGFLIDSMHGRFYGMGVALQAIEQATDIDQIGLQGDLALDMSVASDMLKPDLRQSLANMQVGKGYTFRGNWLLNKTGNGSLYNFDGLLIGNNIEFKGYQFQQLQADVKGNDSHINARNFWLLDSAGSIQIDHIAMDANPFTQESPTWTMALANITFTNFRPSLLHVVGLPPPATSTHFVIPKLQLELLQGVMGEAATFYGNGTFNFSNHSKRVLHHPLFVIPTEILNRIGLDLAVLNPVMGIIHFNINNSKVFLTKFKDVYSEGKLSKFYLPSNGSSSYIDFDGNLNVQVRMKQYNLLFKIAELFTVNVSGTLQRPVYSLQKQPHKARPYNFKRKNSG